MLDAECLKLFAQLDSDFPNERNNALELLVARMKNRRHGFATRPITFRELANQLKRAGDYTALEQRCQAAEASLQQHQQANRQAQAAYTTLQHENARLRAALVQSGHSALYQLFVLRPRLLRMLAVLLVVGVASVFGYRAMQPAPEPAMTAAAEDQLLALIRSWQWMPNQIGPIVRILDGRPWWVMATGDQDSSSFVNENGGLITLQCFHFFARPASTAFGSYFKPSSSDGWQERGRDCKPVRTATR